MKITIEITNKTSTSFGEIVKMLLDENIKAEIDNPVFDNDVIILKQEV